MLTVQIQSLILPYYILQISLIHFSSFLYIFSNITRLNLIWQSFTIFCTVLLTSQIFEFHKASFLTLQIWYTRVVKTTHSILLLAELCFAFSIHLASLSSLLALHFQPIHCLIHSTHALLYEQSKDKCWTCSYSLLHNRQFWSIM